MESEKSWSDVMASKPSYGTLARYKQQRRERLSVVRLIVLTSLLVLSIPVAFLIYADDPYSIPSAGSGYALSKHCTQVDPLRPTVKTDKLEEMERNLASDDF
ncbi:hypothetical protein LTS18_007001, partial [Coniosporium uncinatum]